MTWYPLWSILIITLDIVVIYQLTARWNKVEEGVLAALAEQGSRGPTPNRGPWLPLRVEAIASSSAWRAAR